MNINDLAKAQLGMSGAIFHNSTDTLTCGVEGYVFVAIHVIAGPVTFNSTSGLVAVDNDLHLSTETVGATNKIDAHAITLDTITFDAGTTLYGQWTQIILTGGSIIAYLGPRAS